MFLAECLTTALQEKKRKRKKKKKTEIKQVLAEVYEGCPY